MKALTKLYHDLCLRDPETCTHLTGSASNRQYYRLSGDGHTCVGAIGTDVKENEAFLALAAHLRAKGLNLAASKAELYKHDVNNFALGIFGQASYSWKNI